MKTIRYTLEYDTMYLYQTPTARGCDSFRLENPTSVFLDILDTNVNDFVYRVKMFFPNGDIKLGYVLKDKVKLSSTDELFDGRFNS